MENTNLAAADSVLKLVYIQHKGALLFQDRKRFFDAVLYIVSHEFRYWWDRSPAVVFVDVLLSPTNSDVIKKAGLPALNQPDVGYSSR